MEISNNNKHAYCIIAHNEPKILATLVELIDDERNDIFLLVDKKTDIGIYDGIHPKKAKLYLSPRVDIRWGDTSQILAELTLFEFAYEHGPYKIYHLLSGVDLPIKSQDYIHEFIADNPNTEFVGFVSKECQSQLYYKTNYYHFFTHFAQSSNASIRKIASKADGISIKTQRMLGVKRKCKMQLMKGCNWCSITNELVSYLIENKDNILHNFAYMLCADEIFLQTMVWNSKFMENVYAKEEYVSCLREINWTKGSPYIWGSEDVEDDEKILKESKALFARKFTEKHYNIVESIKKQQK